MRKYPKCDHCPHNRDMHSATRDVGCWICGCQAVNGEPVPKYELGWKALAQLETMAKLAMQGAAAAEELVSGLPAEVIVDYRVFTAVRSGYQSAADLLRTLSRLGEEGQLAVAEFRPSLGFNPDRLPRATPALISTWPGR
jgi:hypothetical protein